MNSNLALRAFFDRNRHTPYVALAAEDVYVRFAANTSEFGNESGRIESFVGKR